MTHSNFSSRPADAPPRIPEHWHIHWLPGGKVGQIHRYLPEHSRWVAEGVTGLKEDGTADTVEDLLDWFDSYR